MRYLVDFHHNTSQTDIDNYLSTNGCTVLQEWDNFDKVFLVECTNVPPADSIIEHIVPEDKHEIKLMDVVEVDRWYGSHEDPNAEKINIDDVNDVKNWWKNYSWQEPSFDQGYTMARYGHLINVYLLDSGLEHTHPEFENAVINNLYSCTPGDFSDHRGHGTGMASLIVGKTCGITAATLNVVKIFEVNHTTMLSEILSALDAIIAYHPANSFGVVNCSWVMEKNEYVEAKLKKLTDMGLYIIACAGNQGTEIENVTPASMMEAVTVGAYNRNLEPCDFSNYTGGSIISVTAGTSNHGEIDGWAPGEEIYMAGLNGTYGFAAGTSCSAAIASACATILLYWFSDDDGKIAPGFENFVLNSVVPGSTNYIFKKANILNLDDPKYANCKNAIATIYARQFSVFTQKPDEFTMAILAGTQKPIVRVFEPQQTLSYEFIEPLPENFFMMIDGRIYGAPTLDQGPSEGEEYKTHIAKFNRVSLDGTSELVTLNIYIFPPDVDTSQDYPPDHPVKLLLQNDCNFFGPQCYIGSGPSYCQSGCTGGLCCSIQFGKSALCTCI